MDALLKSALDYHNKGFKVIFTNAEKMPAIGAWAKYRTNQTEQDIQQMYKANKGKIKGLAVLCTDGMEVIDIDQKYSLDGQLMSDYIGSVAAAIGEDEFYSNITISITQSGGAHIIYRTNKPEGNQKLASRAAAEGEESQKVLLETRGIGGYIIAPPSPGYKFDIQHKDFAPMISDEWRDILINTARTFDEVGNNFTAKSIESIPVEVKGPHISTIDAFNEAHTPYELLINQGWTFSYSKAESDFLYRPGKNRGSISAGYSNKLNLVYIWTTSTSIAAEKAYNAFQVYAHFNHGGDYKAAAKQLYRDGYGDRMTETRDSDKVKTKAVLSDDKEDFGSAVSESEMERIYREHKFSIEKKPKFTEYCLTYADAEGEVYNIGAYGDIITITGLGKSRKSCLGSSIVASAIGGVEVLGFMHQNGNREILYIDTEQTEAEHYKVQERVYKQAKVEGDPENYHAWTIGEESRLNMVAFIKYLVEKHKDIGVLFIDGIVDLCANYNDLEQSQELVGFIKKMANKHNIMIINILHNARSTGDARGHLGTELINKSKAVIEVVKDTEEDFSTVKFKYLREKSPSDFDFSHDANSNLVIV